MKTRSVFVLGIATGVALGTALATLLSGPSASAQIAPLSQPQQRGPTINLDERRQEMVYANGYRLFTSNEEVIADMGFNMPNPNRQAGNQADLLFDVRMRLVMSYATAKRFQDSLHEIISKYEEMYGQIKTEPPQPKPATQPR